MSAPSHSMPVTQAASLVPAKFCASPALGSALMLVCVSRWTKRRARRPGVAIEGAPTASREALFRI